jgi:transcriptional regulator with XRE-family HTH domain
MEYISQGKLIKHLRKQNGFTQERLAEGIMDRSNLARIENGDQAISKDKLDLLTNKLGYTAKRFFTYALSNDEYKYYTLRDKLENALARCDIKKATELIDEMEKYEAFRDGHHKQFLLKGKAALILTNNSDYIYAYALLSEAIQLTIPKFSEKLVSTYLLAHNDIEILCMIAETYDLNGEPDKAIDLLLKMSKSVRKYYVDEHEKTRSLAFILSNLSACLGMQKRYKEALDLCDEAIEECKRNQVYGVLPVLTFNKACSLFYLNRNKDVKRLLRQAYYGSMVMGLESLTTQIKDFALSEFKINIEL